MKYSEGSSYMAYGPTRLRVTQVGRVHSKKQTPGMEFTLTNGESKDDGSLKTIRHTFWLTDKANYLICGFLRACGLSKAQIEAWNEMDVRQDVKFVGLEVMGTLVPDEADNGKTYTKVEDGSWEALGATSGPKPGVPASQVPQPPQDGGDDGSRPNPTEPVEATSYDMPF